MPSDLNGLIQRRTAELVLAEVEAAYLRSEYGVVAQDIGAFDRSFFMQQVPGLFTKAKGRVRIALVGDSAAIGDFVDEHPKHREFITSEEEVAVQWRNKRLKTIFVIANGSLNKQGSLKEFTLLSEQHLIKRMCDQARDKAEVAWLRTLWDALSSPRGPGLSLRSIVTFAETLDQFNSAQRSVKASAALYALGLFPDDHLAEESTEARIIKRLKLNATVLAQVCNAAPEDLDRMANFCRSLTGPEKTRFNAIRKRLGRINQRSTDELAGIQLTDVQTLWRGKVSRSNGDGGGNGGSRGPGKVAVESLVAELLLEGEHERLKDLAESVHQLADQAEDEQLSGDAEPLVTGGSDSTSGDAVPVVDVKAPVIALAKSRSTESEWGGVIDIESDRLEALTEVSAFKAWQPFEFESFRSLLQQFVDAQLAPSTALDLADSLAAARRELLTHLGELTTSPVTVLAGRGEVLAAAERFLLGYDQLLKQIEAAYTQMYADAGEEAETIVHWLLSIELYVYRREGDVTEVLLSPIHPLNLWRSLAIVKDLQVLGGKLSKSEQGTLIAASAEDLQLLNVLVLPRIAGVTATPALLGQAGAIDHLPLFKESPRGVLEPDGMRTVAHLSSLIAQLRPYVRPGLQILFVNAPRPSKLLEEVLNELDLDNRATEDTFWGVHFRFRYTLADTRGWSSELEELDDQIKDRLKAGQDVGLVSVSVRSELTGWEDLLQEVKAVPSHLTVVFDPFEVRTMLVARAGLHDMSPWMPSCEYRYNKLKKQIVIVPIAEEQVFATYFSTAKLVHRELKQSTATHQPQVTQVRTWLDQLAAASTWTVIADPHRVLIPRLNDSEVIDRRIERGRQLTTFGRDLSPFVRKLDRQLRRTHFVAEDATLEDLIRDLVAMEPNGILGLVGGDKSKHVKGALGKLIAMRWYRRMEPSGLSVSLDTQNATRWLSAGAPSGERADLIGIREDGGELRIDVIEVKTHDEGIPYTVSGGVASGHAVDQILATLHALAEVFGGQDSPLAKPRREVLREHLYTALMRDLNPAYIERWHALLQDLFNGSIPVKLSGRLIHVRLASVASTETVVVKTMSGIPLEINTLSAGDVGLMLSPTKPEDVGEALGLPAGAPGAPQGAALEPRLALDLLVNRDGQTHPAAVPGQDDSGPEDESPADDDAGTPVRPRPSGGPAGSPTAFRMEEPPERDVTSARPHASGSLDVPLGQEVNSKQDLVWSPGKQSNGFFLILGASGSGKTETLKVLGNGISQFGTPVLVLDFHGDVKFPGLESILLSSGTSSTIGLNPMELDSHSAEETGLYDQRKVIRDMIRNAVPALGHRQGSILRDAIEEAYVNAGFNDADPATWKLAPPTFSDVVSILSAWAEDDARKSQRNSIEGCIAAIQEIFEHPIFQRTKHVSVEDILSKPMRLDLSRLSDEVRYITAETLLRKIFRVLRLKGPIPVQPQSDHERFRLFVAIDEAKILSTGGGDPDSPDRVLNLLFTEARKFGLGMILASQMSDHFGSEVTANAATWLVMKPMDIREARKNAPNVQMEPEALTALRGKGDGYFRDRSSPRARRLQVRPLSQG
ncbi:MAG: DUF853 family protein [Rubrivivax sp.]|nr:DUF853 family protein [Rubrivivax sp.]